LDQQRGLIHRSEHIQNATPGLWVEKSVGFHIDLLPATKEYAQEGIKFDEIPEIQSSGEAWFLSPMHGLYSGFRI